ncbi:MAG: hypothetical protein JWM22_3492 [Frankiales bacterium]|nr:hypothetical protein [Frankiales bacterium]
MRTHWSEPSLTFNVFDPAVLAVFDVINAGTRKLSVYERLAVPGPVDGEDVFTYVVDPPLCGVRKAAGAYQHHTVTLGRSR